MLLSPSLWPALEIMLTAEIKTPQQHDHDKAASDAAPKRIPHRCIPQAVITCQLATAESSCQSASTDLAPRIWRTRKVRLPSVGDNGYADRRSTPISVTTAATAQSSRFVGCWHHAPPRLGYRTALAMDSRPLKRSAPIAKPKQLRRHWRRGYSNALVGYHCRWFRRQSTRWHCWRTLSALQLRMPMAFALQLIHAWLAAIT